MKQLPVLNWQHKVIFLSQIYKTVLSCYNERLKMDIRDVERLEWRESEMERCHQIQQLEIREERQNELEKQMGSSVPRVPNPSPCRSSLLHVCFS